MGTQPGIWQKLAWRFSPLGRARLALSESERSDDCERALLRLRSALQGLQRPGKQEQSDYLDLSAMVLERIADLAMDASDLGEGVDALGRLDGLQPHSTRRTDLRWRLVQLLIAADDRERAASQGSLYSRDADASLDTVAELLAWSLSALEAGQAAELAVNVGEAARRDARVETLWSLCRPADVLSTQQPAASAESIKPELLSKWPALQCRAGILKGRCFETQRLYARMLPETESARAADPSSTDAVYWHARALLGAGRASDALAVLPQSAERDPISRRLASIASLASAPELDAADDCVLALEKHSSEMDSAEVDLAVSALRKALVTSVSAAPEKIGRVGELSRRIADAIGPAPWTNYNQALCLMQVEHDFRSAADLLAAGAEAPVTECPARLLQAACAAVLGRREELNLALEREDGSSAFECDERYFVALAAVWASLTAGTLPDDVTIADLTNGGQLVRSVRPLHLIGALAAEVMIACESGSAREGRVPSAADLAGSDWARWLWQRYAVMLGPVSRAAEALRLDGDAALMWQQAGYRQDFAALVPDLDEQVRADLEAIHGACGDQREEVQQRMSLARLTGSGALIQSAEEAGGWFDPNSPLCELSALEARIEGCYLNGRLALRSEDTEAARTWLATASRLCESAGPLTKARFAPVLDYWLGVAEAHAKRYHAATQKLSSCVGGPKEPEARAQLGLIALDSGDISGAEGHLASIGEPRPASAAYLTALVADRKEQTEAAKTALAAISATDGVYAAAADRAAGAIAERCGDADSAIELYERALAARPGDRVAAVRLARGRTARAYARAQRGEAVEPEALPDIDWALVRQLEWARPLAELSDWLDTMLLGCDPPQSPPDNAALKRLALRAFLAAGRIDQSTSIMNAENGEVDEKLRAVRFAARIANSAVEVCANGPSSKSAERLQKSAANLRALAESAEIGSGPDFWLDLATALTTLGALEHEELFAATLSDRSRPATERALAGVICLFSESEAHRDSAADVCEELCNAGLVADDTQKAVVGCLLAMVRGDNAALLSHYSQIEENLSLLPCDEATAYVAASCARLRIGEVEAVTHGFIPDSLAELSDPEVRRVVGMAYVQRAARHADRDARQALNDLEQAVELLADADRSA